VPDKCSVVTAVNSLRTLGKSPRLDLWATPELVPAASEADTQKNDPRRPEGSTGIESLRSLDGLGAVEVVADVLEDLADDRAQEEQGDDHDDRDEGEEQTVLDERLTLLIVALETSQKIADEVLDHVECVPPFRRDLVPAAYASH
jgi:hypothetical protein